MSVATLWHVLKSMVPYQSGGVSSLPGVAQFVGPTTAPWSKFAEVLVTTSLAPAGPTATLTADQLAGGLILVTPTGSTTYTLPTAAQLMAAFPKLRVNHAIRCTVKNLAAATFSVTLAAGTGGTMAATDTWVFAAGAPGTSQGATFWIIMTAVGPTPTYTCRSMGMDVN